jgi:hypothetical protein
MPTSCARWPDGSFSIVGADDETDALIQLDELGDEPAELGRMDSCLLDFDLTDEGTFRLKQFGEQTGPEILERGYPLLSKTLEGEAFAEHAIEGAADPQKYGSAATEILRKAVETERDRLKDFQRTSATQNAAKSFSVNSVVPEPTLTLSSSRSLPNASADASPGRRASQIEQHRNFYGGSGTLSHFSRTTTPHFLQPFGNRQSDCS